MLDHLRAKNPPANLVPVLAEATLTGLGDGIADVCCLAFILHEIKEPGKLIAEAGRLLKPGGRLVIVEWRADLASFGPPPHRRISREAAAKLLGEAGLTFEGYRD